MSEYKPDADGFQEIKIEFEDEELFERLERYLTRVGGDPNEKILELVELGMRLRPPSA